MIDPWNEPDLTPEVRALRRKSATLAAFNAYVRWSQTEADEEPSVPDFIDNAYDRSELRRAAGIVAAVLRRLDK